MRILSLPPPNRWGGFRRAVTVVLVASMSLGVVTAPEAWAASLYVATTGSDAGPNNCQTPGTPCRTITHALTQASGVTSDVINVAAGTYNAAGGESFPLELKDGVALIGSTSDPTTRVISAPASPGVFLNSSTPLAATTRLAGFTLTKEGGILYSGPLMTFEVDDETMAPRIDHNRFLGVAPDPDPFFDGIWISDDTGSDGTFTATIENNTFTNLENHIYFYLGVGGGAGDDFSPTIQNNTFSGGGHAIYLSAFSSFAGQARPMIASNALSGFTSDMMYFDIYFYDSGFEVSPTITGNTFTGNSSFGDDHIDFEISGSLSTSSTGTVSPTITNNSFTGGSSDTITIAYSSLSTGHFDSHLTISGNTITAPGDAVFLSMTSLSDDPVVDFEWTITNNTITGMSGSDDGIDISGTSYLSWAGGTFHVTVAGNTITDMDDDGIDISLSEFYSYGTTNFDLLIQGNTVSGCGSDGLYLSIEDVTSFTGTATPIRITDNAFLDNGSDGMFIATNDFYNWEGSYVQVSCNTVTGNGENGVFQNYFDYPADFGGGDVSSPGYNVLLGNDTSAGGFDDLYNVESTTVMAENNWWGDTDPSDQVYGPVDYTPWATAAPLVSLSVPLVDAVTVDVLPTGASVGDTITYTATVTSGASDACSNSGVVFTAPIPANAGIVPGSVTTTEGSVVSEDPVVVNLGVLPPNTTVTITWEVIPTSGSSISTQATVGAGKTGDTPSDDPDTGTVDDPTVTAFAQQAEPIPTLAEWGLLLLAGALLLLGAGLLRRRRYVAVSLAAAIALASGWAGAAPPGRGNGPRVTREKRAPELAAASVSEVRGDRRQQVLTLSDGTTIDLKGVELKIRDSRFTPVKPAGRTQAERAAYRSALEALRDAHRDEIRAARKSGLGLLQPGTPVLTRVTYDEHGKARKVVVEVFSSQQRAQSELQRYRDREQSRQQRHESRP